MLRETAIPGNTCLPLKNHSWVGGVLSPGWHAVSTRWDNGGAQCSPKAMIRAAAVASLVPDIWSGWHCGSENQSGQAPGGVFDWGKTTKRPNTKVVCHCCILSRSVSLSHCRRGIGFLSAYQCVVQKEDTRKGCLCLDSNGIHQAGYRNVSILRLLPLCLTTLPYVVEGGWTNTSCGVWTGF